MITPLCFPGDMTECRGPAPAGAARRHATGDVEYDVSRLLGLSSYILNLRQPCRRAWRAIRARPVPADASKGRSLAVRCLNIRHLTFCEDAEKATAHPLISRTHQRDQS